MTFDETLEAAGVPQAERRAFRVDAHRVWLAVTTPLEVPAVRAVMRGLLDAEQIEAAARLGGDRAVHRLLESAGVLPRATPEDELRTSILWPTQVRTTVARRTWRIAVYDAGYALTSAGTPDGRKGALSVPTWVNRVLAAVAHAMHWVGGGMVVEEAARVLRDPDLRLAVRAAFALGGWVAVRDLLEAQGAAHDRADSP